MAGESGERQVRIRIAGIGLPANGRNAVEMEQRMDAVRIVGGNFARIDAEPAFDGQRLAHGGRAFPGPRHDHQAAAVEAGVGFRILEIARKVAKHRQAGLRQRHILGHRVVGTQDA
jgi:hypothetical protein